MRPKHPICWIEFKFSSTLWPRKRAFGLFIFEWAQQFMRCRMNKMEYESRGDLSHCRMGFKFSSTRSLSGRENVLLWEDCVR